MRVLLSQFHSKSHRVAVVAALGVVVWTSGCETAQQKNYDRSNLYTELAAQIDNNAPTDVSGLQGQATYNGAAMADFGGFSGTADARLTADFSEKTINGSLTSWKDLDPENYRLRGQILLSNGAISNDGSFTAEMAGNIERDTLGPQDFTNPPILKVFEGAAAGQIYDSVGGATASHLKGLFTTTSGNIVNGSFIAGR